MDSTKYEEVCRHFFDLAKCGQSERDSALQKLRAEDESLAIELTAIFDSDRAAEEDGFLDYKDLPSLALTAHHGKATLAGETQLPKNIDGYEVIEKIGQGAMGIVYRARDPELSVDVALKKMAGSAFASKSIMDRFRQEVEILAQLEHENIVRIYRAGEHEGTPYFAMKYVAGMDFKDTVRENRLSPDESARLVKTLAKAVAYANDRGIIHRDLKPANILMDVTGKPHVADFGIALRADIDLRITAEGLAVGTPAYMAPEQINAPESIGLATDVYGLGTILYECLTGEPPFEGESAREIQEKVLTQAPAPPSEKRPVDAELQAICLKCLQKDPRDRYFTAHALAADLERYLKGEPPLAAKAPKAQLIGKVFFDQQLKLREARSAGAVRWVMVANFLMHIAVFILIVGEQLRVISNTLSVLGLWLVLAAGVATLVAVNWRYQWRDYWRLTTTERQSGTITLGLNLAFVCLILIYAPLTLNAPITKFLDIYPPVALIVGVAAFAHGAMGASRVMLLGMVYFPLGIVFAIMPFWSPLIFAAIAAVVAAALDQDIRRALSNSA